MRPTAFLLLLLFIGPLDLTLAQSGDAVQIEGGFAYKDMEFGVLHPYEILGTMINKSGRDYKTACFMMKLYNKSDQLLKTVDFCLNDFRDGQSQLFRTTIRTNPTALKGYKILFSGGR